MRCVRHRSLPYTSLARALTFPSSSTKWHSWTGLPDSWIWNPVRLFPDSTVCPVCLSICPTSLPPWLWIFGYSNKHTLPFRRSLGGPWLLEVLLVPSQISWYHRPMPPSRFYLSDIQFWCPWNFAPIYTAKNSKPKLIVTCSLDSLV